MHFCLTKNPVNKMQAKIFVCVLFFTFVTALPAVQHRSNGSLVVQPAIIGGNPPTKINFHEVAIVSDADFPPVKLCSGVLIKTEWVLTSAYCVKDQQVLRVILGSNIVYPNGIGQQGVLVDQIISHPYYNALYMLHDIALLYVRGASSANAITLAAMPSNPVVSNEYVGKSARISGYGLDVNANIAPTMYMLRYKDVQIIPNEHCYTDGHFMNEYKLCSSGRAVCEGDQGGPLTIGNTVVGIASAALRALNCESQISTTYTRVNFYKQWIEQTIYTWSRY